MFYPAMDIVIILGYLPLFAGSTIYSNLIMSEMTIIKQYFYLLSRDVSEVY